MTEEKRLELEERIQSCNIGRLFKAEEKLKGKIFQIDYSREFALVDLERGCRCKVDLNYVAEHFDVGEEVEVVFLPGQSRYEGEYEKDRFCLSFPYFKRKLPEHPYGNEALGTVLIRGSKAIYVVLDEENEIIGCYAPPCAMISHELCDLKSGDKVLCSCAMSNSYGEKPVYVNGSSVNIFDLMKIT